MDIFASHFSFRALAGYRPGDIFVESTAAHATDIGKRSELFV
jgi:hypothetical protein